MNVYGVTLYHPYGALGLVVVAKDKGQAEEIVFRDRQQYTKGMNDIEIEKLPGIESVPFAGIVWEAGYFE